VCDKQMQFCGFKEVITRPELPKNRQNPWTLFEQVEWDSRIYEKGTLVRMDYFLVFVDVLRYTEY